MIRIIKIIFYILLIFIYMYEKVIAQPTTPPVSAYSTIQPSGSNSYISLGKGFSNFAPQINVRPPTINDDITRNNNIGDLWCVPLLTTCWQNISNTAGAAAWLTISLANSIALGNALPLDTTGVSAQIAVGTMLMTRNINVLALNKSADLWRSSDQTTLTVGWNGRYIDAAAADAFCLSAANLWCDVSKLYDQSYNISTGALNSNDATAVPGWQISPNAGGATVATGGSGCTNGTQTFTSVGGTGIGTASQVSGLVTGGILANPLTVVVPGSYVTPPGSPVATTGGGCSVQPTVTVTFLHLAPQWTSNTINGHRSINFASNFTGGNPQIAHAGTQWMVMPSPGVALNLRTVTLMAAIQARTGIYASNVIASLGPAANNSAFNTTCAGNIGISVFNICNTNLSALTNPAVWQFQTGITTTNFNIGNVTGSVSVSIANTNITGGSIGPGITGRSSEFDLLGLVEWNSTLSASVAAQTRSAMNILAGIAPQASDYRIVVPSDSVTYGLDSPYGNNWVKLLQIKNLLNRPVQIINIGFPGGNFVGGARDFTSTFTIDSTATYSSAIPNILVPYLLGRNDIANGASAATTFARNQVYAGNWQAKGTNVKTIAATILPETDVSLPEVAVYNTAVRLCWQVPITILTATCPSGGLGAVAIMDFANDPIWSSVGFGTYLVQGGPHTTDPGSEAMAITAATVLNTLINQ